MASKKAVKKAVKKAAPKAAKAKPMLGAVASKAKAVIGGLGGGGAAARGGGRRRRRKSAMWYAKEIARIKLKRKYDKVRLKI